MSLDIEVQPGEDGRWIAEVPALPGVLVDGDTQDGAVTAVMALALRVAADRLEHGEPVPSAVLDLFSASVVA